MSLKKISLAKKAGKYFNTKVPENCVIYQTQKIENL